MSIFWQVLLAIIAAPFAFGVIYLFFVSKDLQKIILGLVALWALYYAKDNYPWVIWVFGFTLIGFLIWVYWPKKKAQEK